MKQFFILLLALIVISACSEKTEKGKAELNLSKSSSNSIPYLKNEGEATHLIVHDKPFLILGGELHNSSTSNLNYLKNIMSRLAEAGLNTVLGVVSWDLLEPEEGTFDFTLMDGFIEQARENSLKVVILWFGSWKNGLSHYVPDWVKNDQQRFPRVKIYNGKSIEVCTPVNEILLDADLKAYTAMLTHLKETDEQQQTVIMIQMQNEVGVLGDSRDRSEVANLLFNENVPSELMDYLVSHKENLLPELKKLWEKNGAKTSGTWPEIFGNNKATDEVFMAWQYASFMNKETEAGKKIYPLPVYVNAWIVQPQDKAPGDFPSGGPQAHVHDIWRAAGTSIDILAPDIYLPNFTEICSLYSRSSNVLFIPESRAGENGSANAFYAFGQAKAIGYSPFGIDSRLEDLSNEPISKTYNVLSQLSSYILNAQSTGNITGVSLYKNNPFQKIKMGGYNILIELKRSRRSTSGPELGYGLAISLGNDEFFVAGKNIQITFFPDTENPKFAGIASLYEGHFVNNQWIPGRKLNGDAIMLNYHLDEEAANNRTGSIVRIQKDEPEILNVKLYQYD